MIFLQILNGLFLLGFFVVFLKAFTFLLEEKKELIFQKIKLDVENNEEKQTKIQDYFVLIIWDYLKQNNSLFQITSRCKQASKQLVFQLFIYFLISSITMIFIFKLDEIQYLSILIYCVILATFGSMVNICWINRQIKKQDELLQNDIETQIELSEIQIIETLEKQMSNSGSLIRMFIFWANIFSFLAYVMINKSDSEAAILISTFLTFVLDYFFSRNIILSYFAFQKFYPDHSNRLKIIYEKKRQEQEQKLLFEKQAREIQRQNLEQKKLELKKEKERILKEQQEIKLVLKKQKEEKQKQIEQEKLDRKKALLEEKERIKQEKIQKKIQQEKEKKELELAIELKKQEDKKRLLELEYQKKLAIERKILEEQLAKLQKEEAERLEKERIIEEKRQFYQNYKSFNKYLCDLNNNLSQYI